MLIRRDPTHTLTQCWYSRSHVPAGRKELWADGYHHSLCRYCERSIKSSGKKSWVLADGIDLDDLADRAGTRFICVTSDADGMIVARHLIPKDWDEEAVQARLAHVVADCSTQDPSGGLSVRLIGGHPR